MEGWHSKIRNKVKTTNIFEVVKILKDNAQENNNTWKNFQLGRLGEKRKSRYIQLDENINRILKSYCEDKDLKKCLRGLAYIQKFE